MIKWLQNYNSCMTVKDILVGDEYVLVKTNTDEFEFEMDTYGMISVDDNVSDDIKKEIGKSR